MSIVGNRHVPVMAVVLVMLSACGGGAESGGGTLEVAVSTTGDTIPDGYTVLIDGVDRGPVGANALRGPGHASDSVRTHGPGGHDRDRSRGRRRAGFVLAWSHDRQRIAYQGADGTITFANADGTGARSTLTQGSWARWSPDDESLLFTAERAPAGKDIYRIGADGSNPRPVFASPAYERRAPVCRSWLALRLAVSVRLNAQRHRLGR
jgi:WD40 repeat protein